MIVVSHYNEDLSWLKSVRQQYIIYEKGEGVNGIKVENKGREGDTWLRYIIDWYDKMPTISWLLQGNPFDHEISVLEKIKSGKCDTFLLLGDLTQNGYYNKDDFGDLPVMETYNKTFNEKREWFYFAAGAQYGVNKNCIKNKPLDWWIRLYDIYNNTEKNALVFERLWINIWKYNCSKK